MPRFTIAGEGNPDHLMGPKFRMCLADFEQLPSSPDPDTSRAFYDKHEKCQQPAVNAVKCREYFAAHETSRYLKAKHNHKTDLDESSEEEGDDGDQECDEEEEEEDMQVRLHDADDAEVLTALKYIESEPPPVGFDQVEMPSTQQFEEDWPEITARVMAGLETPRPHGDSGDFPPSPQLPELTEGSQRNQLPPLDIAAATTSAQVNMPPPPPPPPVPTLKDPVFPIGTEWASIQRNDLVDKLQDARANNKALADKVTLLSNQLANWKRRADSIRHRETAANEKEMELKTMEEALDSTTKVLQKAEEEQRAAKVANANKSKQLLAKEVELKAVAAQLERARTRLEARNRRRSDPFELHIPMGGGEIVANPTIGTECAVQAGTGCGHVRVQEDDTGKMAVKSYYNITFNKRPASTSLHQPPVSRLKHM